MRTGSADPTKPRPARGFVVGDVAFAVFKWSVYALLVVNVGLYGLHGTPTEQADTAAWVVLLLLFEWETGNWRMSGRQRFVVHLLRLLASIVIVASCAAYAAQQEWLDFANAVTWLAVVVALELDVRVPASRQRFHRLRAAITTALYAALVVFLAAWLVIGIGEGDVGTWLDAWDATLWLLAFAPIELNVFGWATRGARAHPC